MKSAILSLLTVATYLNIAVAQQRELPRAKLTVRVVDESGQPVSNALVRIGFMEKFSTVMPAMCTGLTDGTGLFSGEGYSTIVLGADAQKDGYYPSGAPEVFFKTLTNGMFYPWNPTVQATLRKIENPVPMFAKTMQSDIPEIGNPCGYDLEVGDWVAPHGKGKMADFIFSWTNHIDANVYYDVSVNVTFSNPLDGIQETQLNQYTNTEFRWPRQAPETGYLSSFTARHAWFKDTTHKSIMTFNGDGSGYAYFFRVRSVEQDGKIVSALYGKIDSGICLYPHLPKSCILKFKYYLNPTPLDRNMEFDLKRNLFANLPFMEQPRLP